MSDGDSAREKINHGEMAQLCSCDWLLFYRGCCFGKINTLGEIDTWFSLFILCEGRNETNTHQPETGDLFISVLNTLTS